MSKDVKDMKVIIIDDEILAIETFKIVLNQVVGIELQGTYTNPKEALQDLQTLDVDIIFLDIEMGDAHGIDIARALNESNSNATIVFVTAHAEYAVDAFEVRAFDYLLKPVQKDRLEKTVNEIGSKLGKIAAETKQSAEKDALSVIAMGNFQLNKNKTAEIKWRTKKVKELFAYLWHHSPHSVPRDRIIEDLWEDQDVNSAVQLMHTSFYHLRKTIRDIGLPNPVKFANEQYLLKLHIESDQAEIESIMKKSVIRDADIEKLIHLYKNGYFENEGYEWALSKQQQLKINFLAVLENFVVEKMEKDDLSHILEICLEKMVDIDPYNERFVYLLIDYYGKMKNISKIIKITEHFERLWKKELGIPISEEISSLYYYYITKRKN